MLLPPLVEGRLVRRYKRFFADVMLDGERLVTAHCPNPGAMLGLKDEGARALLSTSASATRKLPLTLEILEADGTLVGINTMRPNALAAEAITGGVVAELAGYGLHRREVAYGKASRVDLVLEDGVRPPAYVEVKNVHLRRAPGLAEFPDSVTTRGAKHLEELAAMAQSGARAVMLFVVQRADVERLDLARDIDPAYGLAFDLARAAGVEMLAYACRVTPEEIVVERAIPVV